MKKFTIEEEKHVCIFTIMRFSYFNSNSSVLIPIQVPAATAKG